ncbi:DUF5916 domain-containing protein [Dokdonia sp. Hel_I_53]|uniref:DUF5916 domain-containing protein n=1 Tax=Dokdonia sp. Hel_I_53 TaxID=1566287 RepID=UPI001198CFF4|nr:DUF5916 domain-containing protein [Dokdonia sp. Hel_I_53]TVZ51466.1 carbohydrate binding protein with CBM9 domain [Dokdonia sp. Hel_I_53]
MPRNFLFFILIGFFPIFTIAQDKIVTATRISTPPKIDGVLTDKIWNELPVYTDFYMLEPSNEGLAPKETQTEFKIAYDDKAVYVAAFMYDDQPDAIPSQFGQRDDINVQADFIAIGLNTYNDGINETRFFATSAGAFGDSQVSSNNEDFAFDVVFETRVSKDDKGWYAEFKIPYNALRFPELDVQDWSINFYRRLIRQNETHTFNRVDKSVGRSTQYNAKIIGVKDIDPPVRLTFFPFAQASYTAFDGETITQVSGGLDVKYGLSDSFTLDAQLIPDFGQAAFDNVRLNLGPFEQTFSENRSFFTEGIDLFRKGGVFFSRRIGSAPSGAVNDLGTDEIININPSKVNLLNSVKISGRTKENLGIGFLNSITEATYAEVTDTISKNKRDVLIEPLTNYNVFVLDQQFNQNSSLSVINTNVTRSGSKFRDANVTGLAFDIANKSNSYRTSGRAVVSNVSHTDGTFTGLRTEVDFFKTKGKFRYRAGHDFANTTFDINDLGLNFRNNFNSFVVGASYEIFEPTDIFNKYRYSVTARHRRLYSPDVHTGTGIDLNSFFVLKSRLAFGFGLDYGSKENDYFEPRVAGRFVVFNASAGANMFLSSDYRKKFAVDVRLATRTFFEDDEDQNNYAFNFSPRYRFSDKMLVVLESGYNLRKNNFGFIDTDGTNVFLGLRGITSIENSANLSYNFDPFKAINLRFRNFWSTADYSKNIFYLLNDDGTRSITEYDLETQTNPNTNFNIWNLDVSFRWRFAPGSEASLLYRNQIFNSDQLSNLDYVDSLNNLFDQPVQHTLSLRVTYFIDYNNIKSVFKKTT